MPTLAKTGENAYSLGSAATDANAPGQTTTENAAKKVATLVEIVGQLSQGRLVEFTVPYFLFQNAQIGWGATLLATRTPSIPWSASSFKLIN